jgi:hypothetical protein
MVAKWHWGRLFFKHFGFLLPVIIPPVLHSHLLLGADIVGPFESVVLRTQLT